MTARKPEIKSASAVIDQRLIKALGHPLRERVLQVLNETVASPAELSRALDEPLGNVSYHVQVLLECDAIELVRTAPVRGAIEHFYRATRPLLSDEQWGRLPLALRRALDRQNLRQVWEDVAGAAAKGGFDDERTHISRTKLELDEEAYEQLAGELEALAVRARALQDEAADRSAKLSAEEREERGMRRAELTMQFFERVRRG